ncbi:hypothetical protein ACFQZR_12795 [Paenibacillus sp. GCM10027629]
MEGGENITRLQTKEEYFWIDILKTGGIHTKSLTDLYKETDQI